MVSAPSLFVGLPLVSAPEAALCTGACPGGQKAEMVAGGVQEPAWTSESRGGKSGQGV